MPRIWGLSTTGTSSGELMWLKKNLSLVSWALFLPGVIYVDPELIAVAFSGGGTDKFDFIARYTIFPRQKPCVW